MFRNEYKKTCQLEAEFEKFFSCLFPIHVAYIYEWSSMLYVIDCIAKFCLITPSFAERILQPRARHCLFCPVHGSTSCFEIGDEITRTILWQQLAAWLGAIFGFETFVKKQAIYNKIVRINRPLKYTFRGK